jgi:hypothetical protein
MTKLSACSLAAAAALLTAPGALADDTSPPPGTPSIGQYVETVPTARGGATAGVGGTQAGQLSPAVARRLDAMNDPIARRLKAIATSSAYGAPQEGSSSTGTASAAGPFSAAITAVSGSSDTRIFWLLGAVIAVTTAMLWATARRHRA